MIAGPTASGKSALALELAEKTGGVILNADSQQMYAELRILTARPSAADEARAPHRLYGTMSAAEACSVGKWLKFAEMEIDWARAAGKPAIVVGGTGMYLKALMEGMANIPAIDPSIRAQAKNDMDAMGRAAFHERLSAIDPEISVKLRPSDTQRVLRAYEVWLGTGKPLSWWQNKNEKPKYNNNLFRIFKVEVERAELYARCDARVLVMLKHGALHEVKNLLTLQLPTDLPAMRVIGVPELSAHVRGEISLEASTLAMQQATRNYAKRQMTWFRNQLAGAEIISAAPAP